MFDSNLQKSIQWRFSAVLGLFLLIAIIILSRLFYISVIRNSYYTGLALDQQQLNKILPSKRGKIFFQDRLGDKKIAAFSADVFDIVVSPNLIKNPTETAEAFSSIFHKPLETYLSKLQKADDKYEVIEKDVPLELADSLTALKIPGLAMTPSTKRTYPSGPFASHALGYVGFTDDDFLGLYGVEKYREEEMTGKEGILKGEKDASGFLIAIGKRIISPPISGADIVLTIDHNIQKRTEEELALALEKWSAESGLALILEPKTGKILALAALPEFDPNEYFKENNYSVFKNPLVESQYELGSVMKPVTMAAAIDAGVVNPKTPYTDTGEVRLAGYKIQNFDGRANGVQTMTQVLEKSLNTGAVFAEQLLGKTRFKKYLTEFGFGDKTGIDLPGELSGDISNLDFSRDIDYATASFGQGIGVTPIQMASAIGAIANGGMLVRPYIVDKIIKEDGAVRQSVPEEVRRVMRPETSEALTKMLVSVVKNGFEGKAGVKGYFVAAKTGTAQIAATDRRGYSDEVIHTFIGYSPAFDPKFLIYLQLNKPTGNRFAANTLTTHFHNLTQYLLNYYEIPPDEK